LKKSKQVQQFEYQCPYQDIYEIAELAPRQQLEGEQCLSSRKTEAYDDEETMIVVINLISVAHTIIRYHIISLSFSVPFRKKEKKKNNSRSRNATKKQNKTKAK